MKNIIIIGGGVAGLSLGIFLRRLDVPVTVLEAGTYPRHKVCGEFLSPRNLNFLADAGFDPLVADAPRAQSVRWFWGGRDAGQFALPHPAVTISRWHLDKRLADLFQALGGSIITSHRAAPEQWIGREGVVVAMGRRRAPGRCRWIGLKFHARDLPLQADLEMHSGRGAYVGLCAVGEGRVNVSGLYRAEKLPGGRAEAIPTLLRSRGLSDLAARIEQAGHDPGSFAAVSHLTFAADTQTAEGVRLGDAWGVIPPFTGNGMSLAMESAWLAAGILSNYASGQVDWSDTAKQVRREMSRHFAPRLRTARLLQRLVTTPAPGALISFLARRGLVPWRRLHFLLGR